MLQKHPPRHVPQTLVATISSVFQEIIRLLVLVSEVCIYECVCPFAHFVCFCVPALCLNVTACVNILARTK
jgi:hypothetical protein